MNPSITIDSEMELLDALKKIHPNSSNRTLRHMLTQKRVTVNGTIALKAKSKVSPSSIIEIHPKPAIENKLLDIIYEDEELIAVNKPPGMLTVATDKMEPNTLHSKVQQYLTSQNDEEWGYIVHRLDKETSGIILFAKDEETKQNLQEQFAERQVERRYQAIVEGTLEQQGIAEDWLIEDKNLRVWVSKKEIRGSKLAITHWKLLHTNSEISKVELKIETGRRHQIRVQLAERGNPVVGDQAHGSIIQTKRLMLHATTLIFIHPNGEEMNLFSKPPSIFEKNTF
ncbi:MAG: hypothetical protein CMB49_03180 [Euryarchaeota archaeon]|nr:hypothetical protein [Euryarchaeota archaeon]